MNSKMVKNMGTVCTTTRTVIDMKEAGMKAKSKDAVSWNMLQELSTKESG